MVYGLRKGFKCRLLFSTSSWKYEEYDKLLLPQWYILEGLSCYFFFACFMHLLFDQHFFCFVFFYCYFLSGTVQHGYGRGSKSLGFPTANLPQFEEFLDKFQIINGVYCGWAVVEGENTLACCVTSIGFSPTFVGQVCNLVTKRSTALCLS